MAELYRNKLYFLLPHFTHMYALYHRISRLRLAFQLTKGNPLTIITF